MALQVLKVADPWPRPSQSILEFGLQLLVFYSPFYFFTYNDKQKKFCLFDLP